jgi:tartrate dehydratase alpha subunit/fumarate hydratase class I-like protein
MCQDTGTALVMGKRGQYVLTTDKDKLNKHIINEFNIRYCNYL